MSRVTAVGAGAVVLVTVAAVAVGAAWDHRRAPVLADEPITTTDLVDQGGRPLTVERGDRLTVDFVGDRLVDGWGSTSPDNGFVAVASREWESGGPVEATTISAEDVDPATVPTADIVVLAFGTDDAGRGELIEPFSERYGALLESMVARNPGTAFVCLGTWLPDAAGRSYDYAIRTQCQARGGRFRTLAEVYRASPDREGSGPSDSDHAAIASLVTGSITMSPS